MLPHHNLWVKPRNSETVLTKRNGVVLSKQNTVSSKQNAAVSGNPTVSSLLPWSLVGSLKEAEVWAKTLREVALVVGTEVVGQDQLCGCLLPWFWVVGVGCHLPNLAISPPSKVYLLKLQARMGIWQLIT